MLAVWRNPCALCMCTYLRWKLLALFKFLFSGYETPIMLYGQTITSDSKVLWYLWKG